MFRAWKDEWDWEGWKRLSCQQEHQWAVIRIKGPASSLHTASLVQCQGLDGHATGVAGFPDPPWAPAHLLLLTGWGRGGSQHVSIGRFCAGWRTKGMPLPILEINALLTELFLRAGRQEVPWVSCCSPLEELVRNQGWTCDSQEPGTGRKEFGLAHS